MTIEEMRAERIRLLTKAREIAATVEGAARDFTPEERTEMEKAVADSAGIGEQLKGRLQAKKALDDIGELLSKEQAGELNGDALQQAGRKAAGTLGAQFADSKQYKAMVEANAVDGRIPDGAKGIRSDRMQVNGGLKSLVATGVRTDTDGANILVMPQQLGVVPGLPFIAPKLRQLVSHATTQTDRVEYAQQVEFGGAGTTNAAKAVKEATSSAAPTAPGTAGALVPVAGGGYKPESGLAFRKASADVITIAHWMPVTKRALSDAGQIRSLIDAFLSRGIDVELDRLILKGNATTPVGEEEWNGILNTSGVQSQAFSTNLPQTIRKAISLATNKGAEVNAVLLAPEADEALDLLQDTTNRYYGNGPFGSGPSTIWGRPRVVVPALSAENKFILGDLTQCVLWDREQTSITATDAHADFFIRNLVAILAEARAAFGIFNPSMIVVGADQ
jgi:hypothetical protein